MVLILLFLQYVGYEKSTYRHTAPVITPWLFPLCGFAPWKLGPLCSRADQANKGCGQPCWVSRGRGPEKKAGVRPGLGFARALLCGPVNAPQCVCVSVFLRFKLKDFLWKSLKEMKFPWVDGLLRLIGIVFLVKFVFPALCSVPDRTFTSPKSCHRHLVPWWTSDRSHCLHSYCYKPLSRQNPYWALQAWIRSCHLSEKNTSIVVH